MTGTLVFGLVSLVVFVIIGAVKSGKNLFE